MKKLCPKCGNSIGIVRYMAEGVEYYQIYYDPDTGVRTDQCPGCGEELRKETTVNPKSVDRVRM